MLNTTIAMLRQPRKGSTAGKRGIEPTQTSHNTRSRRLKLRPRTPRTPTLLNNPLVHHHNRFKPHKTIAMDIAYDHIQEEALPEEPAEGESTGPGLNEEFQEAFKAVSLSPWGAKLGGFLGQLKTQVRSSLSNL